MTALPSPAFGLACAGWTGSSSPGLRPQILGPCPDERCILAMAQYQLNRTAEARAALATAAEITRTKLPKLDSGDLGESWWDYLLAQMLLREAQALIGPEPPPPPRTPQ